MKRYLKLFILLFLLPILVSAKTIDTNQFGYGGTSNDLFNSVDNTLEDGYIAVGNTMSKEINGVTTGVGNGLVVKYDKNGTVLWEKWYGGNGREEFYDVVTVSDGYVVVGYTSSTDIDGLTNKGGIDALVVKYDKDGKMLWNTLIGGVGDDYIHAIKEMSNGNLVIVGRVASSEIEGLTGSGGLDAFIGILSKDGKLISKKLYGGTLDDSFYDVEIKDNYIYVVGYSKSNLESHENIGLQDSIFIKYNDDLEVVWEKFYGTVAGDMYRGIKNTIDGGFIVVGFNSNDGSVTTEPLGTNGMIVKYDKNGNMEWSKVYGGSSSDSFEKVEVLKSGDYIVVGKGFSVDVEGVTNNGNQEAFMILYNSKGEMLWHKWIGGKELDILDDVVMLDNNEFVAVGYARSQDIEGVSAKGGADGIVVNAKIHYVITELPTENGTFSAYEDEDIGRIELSPGEGFKLDKITIKDTLDRNVSFKEDNGKYYFELYDDVTVEVLFRKDEVENPNTGDSFLMYIITIFGLIGMLLLAIRYFSRNYQVYEK